MEVILLAVEEYSLRYGPKYYTECFHWEADFPSHRNFQRLFLFQLETSPPSKKKVHLLAMEEFS